MLVVDDGSPDGTGDDRRRIMAQHDRASTSSAAAKDGAGHRLHRRISVGARADYDFVFEMDADFSHDPAHLPQFLRRSRTPISCSARGIGTAR